MNMITNMFVPTHAYLKDGNHCLLFVYFPIELLNIMNFCIFLSNLDEPEGKDICERVTAYDKPQGM